MRIQTLSLFPEQIEAFASTSILCRAIDQELLSVEAIQIRNYAVSDYGKVDDRVYGGGTGMLLMADPVYRAWETAQAKADHQACTYYMSPKGTKLTQEKTQELALLPEIILICGHYEGIDERVLDRIVDEEISIGDYVLTGGELAAAVLIDCVSRLIPGVLPDEEAWQAESIASGLLEHPHFTRPAAWSGDSVPDVLLSGHAARIEAWRRAASLHETVEKRPDLFARANCSEEDWKNYLEHVDLFRFS